MLSYSEPIYILLSRSATMFSRLIGLLSGARYTHAAISVSGPCGPYYSFGRLYPRLPFPGGFITESPDKGFYALHPDTPCCLYELDVSDAEYDKLRHYIQQIEERKGELHYNLLGVIFIFLRHPRPRKNHFFCSQFVAASLEAGGVARPAKPSHAVHPEDFSDVPGMMLAYEGRVDGLLTL